VCVGRGPAPDVVVAALEVRAALHLGQLGRPRHDGLLDPGRDRRQGRSPRPHGVGGRRRRLLPDDRPGAGDRHGRADPDQGRAAQQQLPRHGPPVAGDVLRRALQRGVPLDRLPRLREVGRGDGVRRDPRRVARGGRAGDREGELDQRPHGRRRVPHRLRREGLPDGARPAWPTTISSSTRPSSRSATGWPERNRHDCHQRPRFLAEPPHPVRARPEPARRARARRQPVRPARLQHLLARRRSRRGGGHEPHHDLSSTSTRRRSSRS
jgi:hypothetical protein